MATGSRLADCLPKLSAMSADEREAHNARCRSQEAADSLAKELVATSERQERWARLCRSLGSRYATCTLAAYECECEAQRKVVERLRVFVSQFSQRCAAGEGLLFLGAAGTGKDHLAVACLRHAVLDCGLTAEHISGAQWYSRMRDRIGADAAEGDQLKRLTSCGVLLISDPVPPRSELTQYQQQLLYAVVDERYRNLRPTWLTMNASGADVKRVLAEQIVSRLAHGAEVFVCDWPSYRTRRAET